MKTIIFTIATVCSLVAGTINTVKADGFDKGAATVLTNVSKINKIEVRGNVELYVSDGSAEQVKVYNRYYAESAAVQNQNGVLRIASYAAQKLVVWVTAEDLRSITAYDNAEVKSFGKLSSIALDVKLYNAASANLDLASYSANINVYDSAKADLKGNVTEYELNFGQSTSVNYARLASQQAHVVKYAEAHKAISNDLATL